MATTTVKLAAFTLALGAAFGAGAAIGEASGPIDVGGDEEHVVEHTPSTTTTTEGGSLFGGDDHDH